METKEAILSLKPCPFCGHKAFGILYGGFPLYYFVDCEYCGAEGSKGNKTLEELVETWNKGFKEV